MRPKQVDLVTGGPSGHEKAVTLLKELMESAGGIRFGEAQEVELKGLAGLNRVYAVDWNEPVL